MTFLPGTRADAFTRVPRAAWVMLRRPGARLAACAALTFALNGCAWTLIQAADATGSVIQAGYAIAANYSSPTFVSGRPADVSHVCIEVNTAVSVGDFVPALQLALERRGIRSDVYNPGTSPAGCEARLVYNAAIDYGRRSFSDDAIQYLSIIDLTLVQNGRILVTARYQTGGLNTDRFSSASTKLNGLIDRMVIDRTDFSRQTLQTSQIN
ncbi:hypothetical protein EN871_26170 [bacterium M00.F.Ca.ET.228.01.1.1]|nr:hypothetical protein [Paraburkholderia phenoliruptrix]MBW9100802.1 hypothetical protein [Paraburkholderia phenoliruptrix]TGP40871.1 hypothetical protein EN871_26170 [bacterium M00.F.Ca.ET.228.01.1.1]TGR97187.1 hypothetical protein EN834_25785 [bacterium M00.F.Ca.ET.191.01.1.1]TGU01700.1 hypothetical protein EN798_25790 [bacterium M00.F.Ca.ET.155.01.1.1]